MNKSISFLAIYMVLAFPTISFAQTSATVSADVFAQLSITKVTDVSFGGVAQTTSPALDPNNINNSTNVGASAALGEFSVSGSNDVDIVVTYDAAVSLTGGPTGTDDDLVFTPDLVGDANDVATPADQSSAASVTNGGTVTLGDDSPNFYLWLGGDIVTQGATSITTASSGSYSGTFSISVTYN